MKSNIKKTLSASMASLTVFSSLGGLSSVKINAAPVENAPGINTPKEDEIEFTFGDMMDAANYDEDGKIDLKKMVDYTPNFFNLLKIDRNSKIWEEAMYVFYKTFAEIICGEQSENFCITDLDGLMGRYLLVGNTINEIREYLINDPPKKSQKIKEAVLKFMKNQLGMTSDFTKKPYKKFKRVLKARSMLNSAIEVFPKLHTSMQTRNVREQIINSEKIRSEMQDPTVKKMVDATLEILKAKEELQIAEYDELQARNSGIAEIQKETKNITNAKREAFSDAKYNFESVVSRAPSRILMKKLRTFDKKGIEKNETKKAPRTRSKSFDENEYFENQAIRQEEKKQEIKDAKRIKAELVKAIKSSDEDSPEQVEKIVNEMNEKVNDPELRKEIKDALDKALKEEDDRILEEMHAAFSGMLGELKEEKEKKSELKAPKEKNKPAQTTAKTSQEKEEKVFTFRDLSDWMKNEKSQEKFELKMAEVCDFIDTPTNRDCWYVCLDQFEKCYEKLTEDFTYQEKSVICKKIFESPIDGILGKLWQLITDKQPEEEYLKAVAEFLGVPVKIKPEEAKKGIIKIEQANLEAPTETAKEVKEEPQKPAETKPEETQKEANEPKQANLEAPSENAKEIKEKPQKPAETKPEMAAKQENAANYNKPAKTQKAEKLEATTKNQPKENFKPIVAFTKKEKINNEKTEKKKSFWSFILDLLEKLPLIGKLIHFLRK